MIDHFDNHLNIRKLILENRPAIIVECGAGDGETTRMLAYMKHYYPFDLHVISDKELPDLAKDSLHWHTGISYVALKEFADDSLDLVFIDTDHNYWTLEQELAVLRSKMKDKGLIVMHDVQTFYHDTGAAMSYWDQTPYPKDAIMEQVKRGGLGDCLIDFLAAYRGEFRLERFILESNGMAVIRKASVTATQIIVPGPAPVYAKPVS